MGPCLHHCDPHFHQHQHHHVKKWNSFAVNILCCHTNIFRNQLIQYFLMQIVVPFKLCTFWVNIPFGIFSRGFQSFVRYLWLRWWKPTKSYTQKRVPWQPCIIKFQMKTEIFGSFTILTAGIKTNFHFNDSYINQLFAELKIQQKLPETLGQAPLFFICDANIVLIMSQNFSDKFTWRRHEDNTEQLFNQVYEYFVHQIAGESTTRISFIANACW